MKDNIVEEKVSKVILTSKQPKFIGKNVRSGVFLVCLWLTYDYEVEVQKLKEANFFQDEVDLNFVTLVNLRVFCYFFSLYGWNFRYNNIFKFLSFVELFEPNYNYIYLYRCLSLYLNVAEIIVNVNELLLRFLELYLFNTSFLYCRKNFFYKKVNKTKFILFENFILKVDIVSFFFLDKYNEAYRRFKYNEYLNTHPYIKNKWFRKCYLRFIYLKKGHQAEFFTDLRGLYNLSLLHKKIFVFFFTAKNFGYKLQHHPIIWHNVMFNSGGLENFALKKNPKFKKFSMRLFFKDYGLYMKYFFFKIFMRYYRRYGMEEGFYCHFTEIYLIMTKATFNFFDVGVKVSNFFEKDFLKRQVLKLNLINFNISFDFLNYNNLDKFYKIYLTESLNFYTIIEAVFCNYFSQFLIDVGYSFDEMGWSQFVRFFEEFFINGLFDFYFLQNFTTILDYFCWRISNVDFGGNKTLYTYIKNSSFDGIHYSRYVTVLHFFKNLHKGYYRKNLFDSRMVMGLYIYRDIILKMAFSSYFLVILYFFLFNHQKILKIFFFVFNKRVRRILLNRVSGFFLNDKL